MNVINTIAPLKSVNNMKVDTSMLQTVNCIPAKSRAVKYIVLHYTGNQKDTAKSNARYFQTGGRGASAHYFVDDSSIYQSVALKNKAWHCGTKGEYYHACRNADSIGIEMCCSGGYQVSKKTQGNAAYLTAELCKLIGITAAEVDKYVIRHYDVTHKKCPAQWVADSKEYNEFKEMVKYILKHGTMEKKGEEMIENSKVIVNDKEVPVRRILKDGTNFIAVRDVGKIFNCEVSAKGNIPVLKSK